MLLEAKLIRLLAPGAIMGVTTGLIIVLILLFLLFLIFVLAAYIYYCLVWYTLANKLKYKNAWIAWIPIANLFLIPILAKQHWALGFLLLIPVVNLVFLIIWSWEIYKRRKFSGALSLIKAGYIIPPLIPFVFIADFVIMGIIAFEK